MIVVASAVSVVIASTSLCVFGKRHVCQLLLLIVLSSCMLYCFKRFRISVILKNLLFSPLALVQINNNIDRKNKIAHFRLSFTCLYIYLLLMESVLVQLIKSNIRLRADWLTDWLAEVILHALKQIKTTKFRTNWMWWSVSERKRVHSAHSLTHSEVFCWFACAPITFCAYKSWTFVQFTVHIISNVVSVSLPHQPSNSAYYYYIVVLFILAYALAFNYKFCFDSPRYCRALVGGGW